MNYVKVYLFMIFLVACGFILGWQIKHRTTDERRYKYYSNQLRSLKQNLCNCEIPIEAMP
jgi:hypothetical protein